MPGLKVRTFIFPMAVAMLIASASATLAAEAPASQKINWRPFDVKTFQDAKEQGKLVFLSIQAPWGHWDRIMSEITFADPNVITLINDRFVPIRIDLLLRPDIWTRYGMGGSPTTTFLLHTGQPMYFRDAGGRAIRAGGNYYSTESMLTYLQDLVKFNEENKEGLQRSSDAIANDILARKDVNRAPLTPEILEATVTRMLEAEAARNPDPQTKANRAPDVDIAELAFAYWVKKGNRNVLDTALRTLVDMARGGIHDQLDGGFHHFAVDAAWRVSVFEKTLSVNAEMLQAYTDAYMVTGGSRYREIAEGIANYVLNTLHDPAGWFYAYQAADTRLGDDGDYYTWTLAEAKAALSEEEQQILLAAYEIGAWGEMVNSAPRRNVLFLSEGPQLLSARLKMDKTKVTEIFEQGRKKLLDARSKRPAPAVGKLLVTEANAEMAEALISAGDLLRHQDMAAAGLKALDLLWEKLYDSKSGLMDHAWSPESGAAGMPEFFSDQVQTVRALIAAHESTGGRQYLDRASQIATAADKAFADSLNGGWMDRLSAPEAPGFVSWPTSSLRDDSLFAESLARIRYLSGAAEDDRYLKTARKGLEAWADEFSKYKEASAPFGVAVDHVLNPPVEVILIDADAGLDTEAKSLYAPWRVVRRLKAQTDAAELKERHLTAGAGPACFFCQQSRCAGPYTKTDKPRAKFDEFLGTNRKTPATPPSGPKGGRP